MSSPFASGLVRRCWKWELAIVAATALCQFMACAQREAGGVAHPVVADDGGVEPGRLPNPDGGTDCRSWLFGDAGHTEDEMREYATIIHQAVARGCGADLLRLPDGGDVYGEISRMDICQLTKLIERDKKLANEMVDFSNQDALLDAGCVGLDASRVPPLHSGAIWRLEEYLDAVSD